MYAPKSPAPGAGDTELEASVLRSSTSYVFIFLLKMQTKPALPVSAFGMWKVTQQDSLANRSDGAFESCLLASCLGGGPFEWNLVLWKEEEDKRKALGSEQLYF